MLGQRKKIAKFLMRTFTCRSTFLWSDLSMEWLRAGDQKAKVDVIQHLQGETQLGGEASKSFTPCTAVTFPSVFSKA
jgi:hypothetical protein